MTIEAGSIRAKITANTAGLVKGINEAKTKIEQLGGELKNLGTNIRNSINDLGKWSGAAVAAAGAAGIAIAKSSINATAELKNQANAAGLSVKALQQGAFAANQFGIEQEKYSDILKDVNDRVGDFISTGAGPMKDFFDNIGPKVGVTIEQFKGLNSQDALGLFISSLQKANLSQQEMTFYMEALASDSTRLIPLFAENGKKMQEMTKAAEDLGIGLDEIEVANAVAVQKELDTISMQLSNEIAKAVDELAPMMVVIARKFQDWIKEAGGFRNMILPALEKVTQGFGILGDGIRGIHVIFKGLQLVASGAMFAISASIDKISNAVRSAMANTLQKAASAMKWVSQEQSMALSDAAARLRLSNKKAAKETEAFAQSQREAMEKSKKEFDELIGEPLPSEKIKQFFEGLKEESKTVGAEIRKNISPTAQNGEQEKKPGGNYAGPGGESEKLKMFRAETEQLLVAEEERDNLLSEVAAEQREKLFAQLESDKAKELGLEKQYAERRKAIEDSVAAAKQTLVKDSFETVLGVMAQGSKKALAVQKAYGVANALVNVAEGITAANKLVFPLNLVEMARVAAVGAMQIRNIKAASPGGGGGSVAPGGGGGAAGAAAGAAQQGTPQQSTSRIFNVDLTGSSTISSQQARNLLEVINEQAGDGVEINVRGAG